MACESVGDQYSESICAGAVDKWLLRSVSRPTHHDAPSLSRVSRGIRLHYEQLTSKQGIHECLTIRKQQKLVITRHFHRAENTYICVDTTERNDEHAVEAHVRKLSEGDQITQGKDAGEEACLDGTANKSVDDRIGFAETGTRTGEDDDQRN